MLYNTYRAIMGYCHRKGVPNCHHFNGRQTLYKTEHFAIFYPMVSLLPVRIETDRINWSLWRIDRSILDICLIMTEKCWKDCLESTKTTSIEDVSTGVLEE